MIARVKLHFDFLIAGILEKYGRYFAIFERFSCKF